MKDLWSLKMFGWTGLPSLFAGKAGLPLGLCNCCCESMKVFKTLIFSRIFWMFCPEFFSSLMNFSSSSRTFALCSLFSMRLSSFWRDFGSISCILSTFLRVSSRFSQNFAASRFRIPFKGREVATFPSVLRIISIVSKAFPIISAVFKEFSAVFQQKRNTFVFVQENRPDFLGFRRFCQDIRVAWLIRNVNFLENTGKLRKKPKNTINLL